MITIPRAFRLHLLSDGSLTYGNGQTWRRTVQGREQLLGPDQPVPENGPGATWPMGELFGMPALSVSESATTRALDYVRADGTRVRAAIPSHQVPGLNGSRAVNRRIVSAVPGGWQRWPELYRVFEMTVSQAPDGFLTVDTAIATPTDHVAGAIGYFDGECYAYAENNNSMTVIVRRFGTHAYRRCVTDSPFGQSDFWCASDPDGQLWAFTNSGGRALLHKPDGSSVWMPPGENRGVMTFWRRGVRETRVWTVTIDGNGEPVLIGRRVENLAADAPAIQLRGLWFNDLAERDTPEGWEFAGWEAGPGTGFLERVPYDAPETPFVRFVASDAPEDEAFDVPANLTPRWRGYYYSLDGMAGNVGGGYRTTGAIIESISVDKKGKPDVPAEHLSRVLATWTSPKETIAQSPNWPTDRQRVIDHFRKFGSPVIVYADDPIWNRHDHEQDFLAAGVPVVRGLRAYPSATVENADARLDTAAAMVARIRADIAAAPGAVHIARPGYTQQGFWPRRQVRDFNKALTALLEERTDNGSPKYPASKVTSDMDWGWERPANDPWLNRYFDALCDATPTPTEDVWPHSVPKPVEPTDPTPPVPTGPTTPAPTPATTSPSPSTRDAVAIAGVVAALVPLGVVGTQAILRGIAAVRGRQSAEEIAADLAWVKQDAAFRRELSRLAAGD